MTACTLSVVDEPASAAVLLFRALLLRVIIGKVYLLPASRDKERQAMVLLDYV